MLLSVFRAFCPGPYSELFRSLSSSGLLALDLHPTTFSLLSYGLLALDLSPSILLLNVIQALSPVSSSEFALKRLPGSAMGLFLSIIALVHLPNS